MGLLEDLMRQYGVRRVDTPMPGDPRKLEFWPPDETGDAGTPRPKELPLGNPGVQVIDPSVSANDISADIVSHWAVQRDPELARLYGAFSKTFDTPEMQPRLQSDYRWAREHEGERRPYEDWLKTTRIPDYLRGYAFHQWPEKARREAFSVGQQMLLDNMMTALTGGAGR